MIFVAGMPRCGSTWVARALARLTGRRYVHEPFNSQQRPEFDRFNMRYFRGDRCDPGILAILRRAARARHVGARVRERLSGSMHVVVKEVHCVLAAECIDQWLKPAVVIVVRHPCGVAGSWKALGWMKDWHERPAWHERLLLQDDLVADYLHPFADHMRNCVPLFSRLGAYWGAIYHVLHGMAARHARWQWVRHGHLCEAPPERFRELVEALGMRPNEAGFRFLAEIDRALEPGESPFSIRRASRQAPLQWQKTLSEEERNAVMRGAEPFDVDRLLAQPPGR